MVESRFIWTLQDMEVHMRLSEVWKKDLLSKMDKVVSIPPKLRTRVRNTHWDLAQCPKDMSILKDPGPKCVKDITISRAKVGQRLWQYKNSDFTLDNYVKPEILNIYDPLHDRHLANWLRKPGILERLKDHNIIDSQLNVRCRLKEYLDYLRYLQYMYAMEFHREVERRFKEAWQEREVDNLMKDMRKYHGDLIRETAKNERLELIKRARDPNSIAFPWPQKKFEVDINPGRINPEKYEYEDWEYQLWFIEYSEQQEIIKEEGEICEADKKSDVESTVQESITAFVRRPEEKPTHEAMGEMLVEVEVAVAQEEPAQKKDGETLNINQSVADYDDDAKSYAASEGDTDTTSKIATTGSKLKLKSKRGKEMESQEDEETEDKKEEEEKKEDEAEKKEDVIEVADAKAGSKKVKHKGKKGKKEDKSDKKSASGKGSSKKKRKETATKSTDMYGRYTPTSVPSYLEMLKKARKPCRTRESDDWCYEPGWTAGRYCNCEQKSSRYGPVVCQCPFPKLKFKLYNDM